jgi:hypothetical protein
MDGRGWMVMIIFIVITVIEKNTQVKHQHRICNCRLFKYILFYSVCECEETEKERKKRDEIKGTDNPHLNRDLMSPSYTFESRVIIWRVMSSDLQAHLR